MYVLAVGIGPTRPDCGTYRLPMPRYSSIARRRGGEEANETKVHSVVVAGIVVVLIESNGFGRASFFFCHSTPPFLQSRFRPPSQRVAFSAPLCSALHSPARAGFSPSPLVPYPFFTHRRLLRSQICPADFFVSFLLSRRLHFPVDYFTEPVPRCSSPITSIQFPQFPHRFAPAALTAQGILQPSSPHPLSF